jgi:hypothetical protein
VVARDFTCWIPDYPTAGTSVPRARRVTADDFKLTEGFPRRSATRGRGAGVAHGLRTTLHTPPMSESYEERGACAQKGGQSELLRGEELYGARRSRPEVEHFEHGEPKRDTRHGVG